jgi:hypothetical protein
MKWSERPFHATVPLKQIKEAPMLLLRAEAPAASATHKRNFSNMEKTSASLEALRS